MIADPHPCSSEVAHGECTDSPGRPSDTPQHHPPPRDDLTIFVSTTRSRKSRCKNSPLPQLLQYRRKGGANASSRSVLCDRGQIDRLFEEVQRAQPYGSLSVGVVWIRRQYDDSRIG